MLFRTPTELAEITSMSKNFELTFAYYRYYQILQDTISVYLVVNLQEYEPYNILHPFITLNHNK